MENDLVKVYSSTEFHKVEIVKAVLEDSGIPSFEINKKDSSYISIGEIEVYVNIENEVLSKIIINTNNL